MTLIFTPSSLTRYYKSGNYNATDLVDLSNTAFVNVPLTLVDWLETQVFDNEMISQVVLESVGNVGATFTIANQEITNFDGLTTKISVEVPVTFRTDLKAAVSVNNSEKNGQRTFCLSSESLPNDLRDALISAWDYINGLN